jgi:hypothetical protein
MSTNNLFIPIELENVGLNSTVPTLFTMPALHKAIKDNDMILFADLLSAETINEKDKDGITPLMVACIKQSYEMVSILCELEINLDAKCTKKGYTAFMYSCFGRNLDIIKLLISKKCSLSTIDISGEDICYLGLWNPILSLIEKSENKDNNNNLVKCRQCDILFKNENGWNAEGSICPKCLDTDLFGSTRPSISPDELKKINKLKGKKSTNSSPVNISPTTSSSPTYKSTSSFTCGGCKSQVEMTSRACSCGRKSPFYR